LIDESNELFTIAANPGEGEVVNQKTFHLLDDPDKELHSDELTKAYKYGKSLVPFAKFDEANLKWKADSCLKVIGFTERSRVPRHHYMTTVDCIVSLPSDESAAVALSALIHALAETNRVAIVRFVKRANSAPLLGVLTPRMSSAR
jgi:ATP-dependent DNA helicase 2 subunit 2